MGFLDLVKGGNLVREETSRNEIQELLHTASRSISDSKRKVFLTKGVSLLPMMPF